MVLLLQEGHEPKRRLAAMSRAGGRCGFTLVEMIVALTIVSVAATVFIAMFSAALHASRQNQNQAIAMELAEMELAGILRTPGNYAWIDEGNAGAVRITLPGVKEPQDGYPCAAPDVTLITKANQEKLAGRYAKFRWTANARALDGDKAVYEVTVLIHWLDELKPHILTLTTAMPKSLADAAKGGVS